jgi:hypothetical protein
MKNQIVKCVTIILGLAYCSLGFGQEGFPYKCKFILTTHKTFSAYYKDKTPWKIRYSTTPFDSDKNGQLIYEKTIEQNSDTEPMPLVCEIVVPLLFSQNVYYQLIVGSNQEIVSSGEFEFWTLCSGHFIILDELAAKEYIFWSNQITSEIESNVKLEDLSSNNNITCVNDNKVFTFATTGFLYCNIVKLLNAATNEAKILTKYSENEEEYHYEIIISKDDVPPDWYDSPLKVQVYDNYHRLLNETTEFFFLQPPNISIKLESPKCYGGSGQIVINDIPKIQDTIQIQLDIIQLYDDSSNSLLDTFSSKISHPKKDNAFLYYGKGSTQIINIEPGQSTYPFTPDSIQNEVEHFTLKKGWYMVKAFYLDKSFSQYCSFTTEPEFMNEPDEILIDSITTEFSESKVLPEKTFHINKYGGKAKINTVHRKYDTDIDILWAKKFEEESFKQINDGFKFTAGKWDFYVDSAGCSSETFSLTFNEPDEILTQIENKTYFVIKQPKCHIEDVVNENDDLAKGSLVINILQGGIQPFLYNVSKQNDEHEIWVEFDKRVELQLDTGEYQIQIKDHEYIFVDSLFSIVAPDRLSAISKPTNISCFHANDGVIAIKASKGKEYNDAFTYWWKVDEKKTELNTAEFKDLKPYDYVIYFEDNNGCRNQTKKIPIAEPNAALAIIEVSRTSATCKKSDGSVTYSINGGWQDDYPYHVILNGDDFILTNTFNEGDSITDRSFSGLSEGQYKLKVYSAFNSLNDYKCTDSTEITILPANPLSNAINILEVKKESCIDKKDAIIEISGISNINSNYDLFYGTSTGDRKPVTVNGSNQLTGLTEGNYKLWIEEREGSQCETQKDVSISIIDNPITIASAVESNRATCETASNGAITISHSGGVGPVSEFLFSKDNFISQQSERVFSGLAVETYTVYAKDAVGCVAEYSDVEVTAMDNPISWNFTTHQNASCRDAPNGTIIINEGVSHRSNQKLTYYKDDVPYGGDPISLDGFYKSLIPRDYSVKIADNDGCFVEEVVTIGSLDYAPTLLFETITPVACDGKVTGQIEVAIEDNVLARPDFSIDLGWMNEGSFAIQDSYLGKATSTTFQNLTNKEYTIQVKDGNNCSNKFTYTPELHSPVLTLTENWIDAPCENANGAIEMSATGGFSEGSYYFYFDSIFVGQGSEAIINRELGAVGQVKVMDSAGCFVLGKENQAVRIRDTSIKISILPSIKPTCIGGDDGKIRFVLKGAVGLEYYYILTDQVNSESVYTGSINPGDVTISGLTAGTYDLVVVEAPLDGNSTSVEIAQGCSVSYPGVVILDWESLEVNDFTNNHIRYFGDVTGSMEVTITGGSMVYDYQIVREENNEVVENGEIMEGYFTNQMPLSAGKYVFRFRDVNQCMYFETGEWYEQSFTIEQPAEPLSLPIQVVNNLSCYNSANGRIEVEARGGWDANYAYKLEGPVNYEWQPDGVFENLIEGTYSVTVKDAREVEHQFLDIHTLTQPDPFSLNVISTKDATCPGYNNGEVDVVSTNGVYQGDGLRYAIINEGGEEEVAVYSGADWKYNKLLQGAYNIEVTDANGCVANDDFTIGEPELVEITSQQNYIRAKYANTGEVSFAITKGNGYYEYTWSLQGAESPLQSGTTDGALIFEDLVAGDYVFMLRDTAHCYYEGDSEWMVRSIRMEEPEFELGFEVLVDSVSCNGLSDGKVGFSGIGGWGDYEFSFEGGAFSTQVGVDELAAGIYDLAVRDSVGNIYERVIEVSEPEVLTVSEQAHLTHVSCYNGSNGTISVDITGGNNAYFVSPDNEIWYEGHVVNHLPVGQFYVYVKDAKGCATSTGPFTLKQPSEIVRDAEYTVQPSTCQKDEGAIFADFSGGTGILSYTWFMEREQSDGSFLTEILPEYSTASIKDLYAGRYLVDVQDEHGCIVRFPFDVNDNTDLSILSINTYPVSCYGYADGAAKAEISFGNPPYRLTWRGEGIETLGDSAWNYNAGEHRLSVWDDKGCYVSEAFEVGTPDSLFYQVLEHIQPLCLGGAKGLISLAGTGGTAPYQYEWNDGTRAPLLGSIDPGNYQVVIKDNHDCVSSFDFDFDYQRIVQPFIGRDTLICHYSTLMLDGGDYARFAWHATTDFSSTNRMVDVNQPATYFLEVTDGDNCIGFDTLTLDVSVLEILSINTKDVRCAGLADGEATVAINTNGENYSVQWPDGTSGISSSGYAGGEYTVSVQNEFGCSDAMGFNIFEPDPLTIITSYNEPLCLGVPDGYVRPIVSGGIGSYRYLWNQGETKREISRLSEGNYVFTVTDDNDCWLTDEFYLEYKRTLLPDLGQDRSVCHGNSVFLNPGTFHKLNWYHDDAFVNSDSILNAELPGEYLVIVNDEDNCIGSDSIKIDISGSPLIPSFLMATSVPMGDTLLIVEVTQPKPKAIEWEIGGGHRIVESGEYFTKIIFDQEGIFPITLSSFSEDGCIGQQRKSILVTAPGLIDEDGEATYHQRNMISLYVGPNPSQGQFNAELKMHEAAAVTFYLVRIDTGQIYETRKRQGLSVYNESFTHSGVGQFVLFVESGGERLMEKIIVL